MSIDTAFQRFREANPVPNPAALREQPVDVLLARQRSMQSTQIERMDAAPSRRPPRLTPALVTGAVLVAVLIATGLLAAVRGGNEAAASLERRSTLIAEQAEAYSAGDFDRWVRYFADDASLWGGAYTIDSPDVKLLFPLSAAAGEQWTIAGLCRDGGTPREVTCPMRQTDDFHGPAGLALDAMFTFTFDEDDRITAFGPDEFLSAHFAPWRTFDVRFVRWFEDAHPEVELGGMWLGNDSGVMLTGDGLASAIEYVDEFIAQSDEYPPTP